MIGNVNRAVSHTSRDRAYLYYRGEPGRGAAMCFVLMHPGPRDEDDAPALARMRELAGERPLITVYLHALRCRSRSDLASAADPIGLRCDEFIRAAVARSSVVVAAWGKTETTAEYARACAVRALLRRRVVHCLGWSKQGEPRHPLRAPRSQQLVRYPL